MAEWTNWAGTVRATPRAEVMVRDVPHAQELCRMTAASGGALKVVGSGHSFTAIAEATDVLVRVDRLSGVRAVDRETARVWVGAGTPLHVLGPLLSHEGLALTNMGDIDRQTIAGAVSTGTHGTGAAYTGLAGQLTGVELVTADGEVRRYDRDDPEWGGVALSLGALGIVTALQIQCVPSFLLQAHEQPDVLDSVLASLDETVDAADHFEFYWFPHTDRVQTKTNTRVADVARRDPLPPWRARLDDDLLSNAVFEGVNRLLTRVPRLTPAANQVAVRALSARTYTDTSYDVFATRRTVRFRESEYSVPRAAVPDLLRQLRTWGDRHGARIPFPVEVRFAAADDLWLSTAYGRETGYVAVHQYHRRDHRAYFEAFWSMLRDHDARPHWGKMHDLDAAELRSRYERFDDFVALRDALDPSRVFGNPYLERVLG
ncbi:D-arabinono-1,4-lactone oxidase [Allobranchiibius sp. GilTou73]|uniref:D-arabinono-1,4-lactone oxidase n=1 Tax=Allobranchiibius sp. GilTou73 TaxID=2904523 RepID=UPI001F42BE4C|nr:D-arabinono-1,4-lactone oxidase [Allobranchiibius sp. GilTou73]UIJ36047.1 FAD-binding protein [Allobranchiibius sp. GilTou73]